MYKSSPDNLARVPVVYLYVRVVYYIYILNKYIYVYKDRNRIRMRNCSRDKRFFFSSRRRIFQIETGPNTVNGRGRLAREKPTDSTPATVIAPSCAR